MNVFIPIGQDGTVPAFFEHGEALTRRNDLMFWYSRAHHDDLPSKQFIFYKCTVPLLMNMTGMSVSEVRGAFLTNVNSVGKIEKRFTPEMRDRFVDIDRLVGPYNHHHTMITQMEVMVFMDYAVEHLMRKIRGVFPTTMLNKVKFERAVCQHSCRSKVFFVLLNILCLFENSADTEQQLKFLNVVQEGKVVSAGVVCVIIILFTDVCLLLCRLTSITLGVPRSMVWSCMCRCMRKTAI